MQELRSSFGCLAPETWLTSSEELIFIVFSLIAAAALTLLDGVLS